MAFSDPSITATNYSAGGGGGSLTATVKIPASVASGAPVTIDVALVNPDKGRGTSPTGLQVTPAPVIDHFTPAGLAPGTTGSVQIIGSSFADDATVTSSDPGLTLSDVEVVSPTEIDLTVAVDAAEQPGARTLTVNNGDGGSASHAFIVTGPPSSPASVDVRSGDGKLVVAWTPPTDDGGDPITAYTLRLRRHASGKPAGTFTTADGSARKHAFTGLTNGARYDVRVTATNALGTSDPTVGHGRPKWATTLSLHRRHRTVEAGDALRLHGALHRSDGSAVRGAEIKVYRKAPNHHRQLIGTVSTGRRGHWSVRYLPTGTASVFAVFRGDRADQRDRSGKRLVRVI
jgi:hypothetical protein